MVFIVGNTGYVYGSSSTTDIAFDSANDYAAWRFKVTRNVAITQVTLGQTDIVAGAPGDLEVIIQGDAVGVPDNTDVGGGSPTAKQFTPNDGSDNTVTFTNAYTPAAGEYIWIVLRVKAGQTADGGNHWSTIHQHRMMGSAAGMNGTCGTATSTDAGTGWTRGTYAPCGCEVLHTDGARVFNESCCYLDPFIESWDSADNPDERGVAWTQPSDWDADVVAVSFGYRPDSALADFTINVYENNAIVGSEAIDASEYDPTYATWLMKTHYFTGGPFTVSAGATGRIMLMATHASAMVWLPNVHFQDAAGRESTVVFGTFWASTNNDAGTPVDVTEETYLMWPHLTPSPIGAGVRYQPGMTGGTGG